jgi:hypothetical protein
MKLKIKLCNLNMTRQDNFVINKLNNFSSFFEYILHFKFIKLELI